MFALVFNEGRSVYLLNFFGFKVLTDLESSENIRKLDTTLRNLCDESVMFEIHIQFRVKNSLFIFCTVVKSQSDMKSEHILQT